MGSNLVNIPFLNYDVEGTSEGKRRLCKFIFLCLMSFYTVVNDYVLRVKNNVTKKSQKPRIPHCLL